MIERMHSMSDSESAHSMTDSVSVRSQNSISSLYNLTPIERFVLAFMAILLTSILAIPLLVIISTKQCELLRNVTTLPVRNFGGKIDNITNDVIYLSKLNRSTLEDIDLLRNLKKTLPVRNNGGTFNKNNICRSTLKRSTLEDVANITGRRSLCERDYFVRIGENHKGILICKSSGRFLLNFREFIPFNGTWQATQKGIVLNVQDWVSLKEQLAAIDCGLSLID